ncbi:MAG: N-acetylmuramoyl-L-alanine amidase [Candidatus Eisenbacteria bacterium]|nr:N-acetylmuramoyl-L-alanine amidase [Candidatus Eisenbacteria bacterium]
MTGRLNDTVPRVRDRTMTPLSPISVLLVAILLVAILPGLAPSYVSAEARKSTRIQGRDYVSMDDAALLLGATKFWKAETRKAVLNVEGTRIRFTVGSPILAVGDQTFVLGAPVLFVRGVPYVPVEFLLEVVPQFSQKRVAWSADNQTLSLLREGSVPVRIGLETSGEFTYVTVESQGKVEYLPVSLSKESFVILLENAVVSAKPSSAKAGLVKKLLVSQSAKGVELRMALDSHTLGYSLKRETGPERIAIGFTSSDSQMREMSLAPFGGELSGGKYRVVVLDPGHGGSDEGVKGKGGAVEKQVNLDIARDIKGFLSKTGTLEVVLTREDDSEQTPETRAVEANAAHGDIFVSIHCDGYASPGASGYCLEVYKAPGGDGVSASEPAIGGVQVSSWKGASERHARASLSLAGGISDRLGSATNLKELGLRRVPAVALEGVDMPSVLVCCGFLTNPGDEALLLDSSSRHRIAAAIAEGIGEFVNEGAR